jgi:hypothetical protein
VKRRLSVTQRKTTLSERPPGAARSAPALYLPTGTTPSELFHAAFAHYASEADAAHSAGRVRVCVVAGGVLLLRVFVSTCRPASASVDGSDMLARSATRRTSTSISTSRRRFRTSFDRPLACARAWCRRSSSSAAGFLTDAVFCSHSRTMLTVRRRSRSSTSCQVIGKSSCEALTRGTSRAVTSSSRPTESCRPRRSIKGSGGRIAPTERWVAVPSTATGTTEIYVLPFPDVSRTRRRISTDGGQNPTWAPDSKTLFYRRGQAILAVTVDDDDGPTLFDVASDGRLLMVRTGPSEADDAAAIIAVQNWSRSCGGTAKKNRRTQVG